MSEIYAIVECLVTYNDGTTELRRPTFHEVSIGLAQVNHISVVKYLRDNLDDVQKIEIIDTLYFRTQEDYNRYIKSTMS